ncbi:hypothetical protein JXB11_03350 [Candidatus Woesearchaeota archaeon]|nr:hypothetical protein [Candidatus Woesearchaeota archaeon]
MLTFPSVFGPYELCGRLLRWYVPGRDWEVPDKKSSGEQIASMNIQHARSSKEHDYAWPGMVSIDNSIKAAEIIKTDQIPKRMLPGGEPKYAKIKYEEPPAPQKKGLLKRIFG